MRLLFMKRALAWPRATGHDVYTYHTMKACAALGHEVSLAVAAEPSERALEGLSLRNLYRLDGFTGSLEAPQSASRLQLKFRSFFGVPESNLAALQHAVRASRAEAAIISGLDVLPYFPVLSGLARIWFAADELLWHHLSQLKFQREDIAHLREGLLQGFYERAHRHAIDRVWVVSETDRKAMRWFAGARTVDVLALGVDGEYFAPGHEAVAPNTAVFWGRLDFGPNVQALEWFCGKIWPLVRAKVPDARFTVMGFNPTDAARRAVSGAGLTLRPDVPDLRSEVRSHSVVVLPFTSGGGTKNKLLEAAALGMPIVCTPLATAGLRVEAACPLAVASSPEQIAGDIIALWGDDVRRRRLGAAARAWVLEHHSWTSTARQAIAALEAETSRRRLPS